MAGMKTGTIENRKRIGYQQVREGMRIWRHVGGNWTFSGECIGRELAKDGEHTARIVLRRENGTEYRLQNRGQRLWRTVT